MPDLLYVLHISYADKGEGVMREDEQLIKLTCAYGVHAGMEEDGRSNRFSLSYIFII